MTSEVISEIAKLYPERRIAESKARLEAVWNLQFPEDRVPFVFSGFPFSSDLHGLPMDFCVYDAQVTLDYQLEAIKARAVLDDDYIPSLTSGIHQGTIATAFGCEEFEKDGQFYVKPVIREVDDIFRLKKLNMAEKGFTRTILERIKYFRKETQGMLPIHMTDLQGPFSIASSLWNVEELIIAMVDHPAAVRDLLDIISEAIIEFVKLQIEAAEGNIILFHCMPFAWMPPGKALALSEDYSAILSPAMYRDFIIPCLDRISASFGGLVLHSCGNFTHNLKNIREIKGLSALNFGVSETPVSTVVAELGSQFLLIPHATEVSSCEVPVLSQTQHIQHSMKIAKEEKVPMQVLIFADPNTDDPDEVLALNRLAFEESKI